MSTHANTKHRIDTQHVALLTFQITKTVNWFGLKRAIVFVSISYEYRVPKLHLGKC